MPAGYPQAHPPDNRQPRLHPLYQPRARLSSKMPYGRDIGPLLLLFELRHSTYTPHRGPTELSGGCSRICTLPLLGCASRRCSLSSYPP